MKKSVGWIFAIIVVLLFIIFSPILTAFFAFTALTFGGGIIAVIPTCVPLITEGEFDFCLEYEIDGERKIITDGFICKYLGLEGDDKGLFGDGMKTRVWQKQYKSGGKKDLIPLNEPNEFNRQICLVIPDAEYFMGDGGEWQIYSLYTRTKAIDSSHPLIGIFDANTHELIEDISLSDRFDFKVINWQCDERKTNTFYRKEYIIFSIFLLTACVIIAAIFLLHNEKSKQ